MRRLWVIAATAAALLSGCGGSSHPRQDPEALLNAAAAHPINSAETSTDLHVTLAGVPELSSPVWLRLDGPYQRGPKGQLPRFAWRFNASAAGFPVGGHVLSTGTNVFLTVYGDQYQFGTATTAAAGQ